MRVLASLTAPAAVLAFAVAASADNTDPILLTSFEELNVGDPGSVGAPSGGAPLGDVVDSGVGITDGAQAVRAENTTGSYDKIASIDLNLLADPSDPITAFQIDWYYEWNASNPGASYSNLSAALGGSFPFHQMPQIGGTGLELNADTGDGLYTVIYTLDAAKTAELQAALTNGTPVRLELFSNKSGGDTLDVTLTVDNIIFDGAIVPEPASASLLAAGLGLMATRRRKA